MVTQRNTASVSLLKNKLLCHFYSIYSNQSVGLIYVHLKPQKNENRTKLFFTIIHARKIIIIPFITNVEKGCSKYWQTIYVYVSYLF